jgi:hypothetical protein
MTVPVVAAGTRFATSRPEATMAEQPNDASRKSKAEGDRPDDEQTRDAADQDTDEQSGGITNRSMDEGTSNQQAVPSRGQAKCGPPGGLGDSDSDIDMESRRSER